MKTWELVAFCAILVVLGISAFSTVTSNAVNDNSVIVVPVSAWMVDSGSYGTERDENNIKNIFVQANTIWRQAGIFFDLKKTSKAELNDIVVKEAINGNGQLITQTIAYTKNAINVYFSDFVGGEANGLSLPVEMIAIIGDTSTVNDFRTLSHELGHLLGLEHSSNPQQLMFTGTNGIHMTDNEVQKARAVARKVFG